MFSAVTRTDLSSLILALVEYLLIAIPIGLWVFADGRARAVGGSGWWSPIAWGVGALVMWPVVLPVYLLGARPAGDLVRCPTCGQATASARGTCVHCGSSLPAHGPAIWALGDVIGVGMVFLFLPLLLVALTGIDRGRLTLGVLSALVILQDGVPIAVMLYVVRTRYHQPLSALGIRGDHVAPLLALGVLIGVFAIAVSTAVENAVIFVIGAVIGHARAEALEAAEQAANLLNDVLRQPLSRSETGWLFILVCVLVPIGEELFFRGFLYGALRARRGIAVAVGVSALVFALAHQYVFSFFPIFSLGVILAILYERTKTLLPGIVVHGLNNLVAVLTILSKSGWHL